MRLEEACKERIFFAVFVHLVAGHSLRVLEVVQDVVIAWVKSLGRLVIVNGETELAAAEVGIAQVVVEVRVLRAVVAAGAPFVDGTFEVTFVVGLGAGLDAVAMFCGVRYYRKC